MEREREKGIEGVTRRRGDRGERVEVDGRKSENNLNLSTHTLLTITYVLHYTHLVISTSFSLRAFSRHSSSIR